MKVIIILDLNTIHTWFTRKKKRICEIYGGHLICFGSEIRFMFRSTVVRLKKIIRQHRLSIWMPRLFHASKGTGIIPKLRVTFGGGGWLGATDIWGNRWYGHRTSRPSGWFTRARVIRVARKDRVYLLRVGSQPKDDKELVGTGGRAMPRGLIHGLRVAEGVFY